MAGPVIAVCDADWACCDMFDAVLADAGYQTVLWAVGTDATELIQRSQPDLVVLDTWLQHRADGWRLLQRLWDNPATASIPVLVCASDAQALQKPLPPDSEERCAMLEKPFDLADLLAQITALLALPQDVAGKVPEMPLPGSTLG